MNWENWKNDISSHRKFQQIKKECGKFTVLGSLHLSYIFIIECRQAGYADIFRDLIEDVQSLKQGFNSAYLLSMA